VRDGERQRIEAIAARVAADRGLTLVEVVIGGGASSHQVRVFLDREGGIGILDLQHASEEISALLDVDNPVAGRFTLEVSSPGLDRPLKTPDDFARATGRVLRVNLTQASEGRSEWTGTLIDATPQALTLDVDGNPVKVPLAQVADARLEVALPRRPKRTNDKRARRSHG
jgi:ribosome maturation factor RimP